MTVVPVEGEAGVVVVIPTGQYRFPHREEATFLRRDLEVGCRIDTRFFVRLSLRSRKGRHQVDDVADHKGIASAERLGLTAACAGVDLVKTAHDLMVTD